jgi:hypothetical protein
VWQAFSIPYGAAQRQRGKYNPTIKVRYTLECSSLLKIKRQQQKQHKQNHTDSGRNAGHENKHKTGND